MSAHPDGSAGVHVILVHGMGRTPVSMLLLARRLRAAGMITHLFAYSAAFERWLPCVERLRKFVAARAGDQRFIVVGHSLGCVLTRAVLPSLARAPELGVFLAPPTMASSYAIKLAQWRLFRLLTGEMGQLLARQEFMDSLPVPDIPLRVYAGIKGPRGSWMPFGDEPNDGILSVKEVQLGEIPVQLLPTIHTVIMNSRQVASDIMASVSS
ncbi:alpha/beta hydrolase family protein [Collimonas fungivorans]|uniref:Alpha/beta hydrolase family protein n=1 Tax=Collimonas fungivorans TaxID=158899 RepID=A0A127PGM2_9BURK|nr:alpha/beta hydrolase [Collimonas fungivorans]AMO96949.1 alpha/beta hydrolase family protein [Collimonas fungivorans]